MTKYEMNIHVYRNLASYDEGHDWAAIDYDVDQDTPEARVGYGKTLREAVEDLLDQIDKITEKSACHPGK
jgi:CRISPR/Cas system-associated exonuclease Cas4 (RecB family)